MIAHTVLSIPRREFVRRCLRPALLVLALSLAGSAPAEVVVDHHQKISSTEGGFAGPLNNGDFFCVPARIGDLDGDGIIDMAVGAGGDNDGGVDKGAVWILFLNNDGTVKSESKISDTEGGFTGTLNLGDYFGWSVEDLGDLDGDGPSTRAIAVGAPLDNDGGPDRGAVWILFLNDIGQVLSHQKISATQGGFTGQLDFNGWFGSYLANMGDLDGDGTIELAVSAHQQNDGGTLHGAVWILFLAPDGTVTSHVKISDTAGGFTGDLDDGDQFGISTANLGDLDGDGDTDLAVGAHSDDDGSSAAGAVWILFLDPTGTVDSHQKISATEGGFYGELEAEDRFGVAMAELGDLDGDGVLDLAVTSLSDDDGAANAGCLWLLNLRVDGTVKRLWKISATEGNFQGHLDAGDHFGTTPELIGDLDGDGFPELAVGAEADDDGGDYRGAVWMLFLDEETVTPVDPGIAGTPGLHSHLVAAAPNPFNPRTTVHYDLVRPGQVIIEIFDVAGRRVYSRNLGGRQAGLGSVPWDGRDDRGRAVPDGTYIVRLVAPDARDAIRVTLVK